MAKTQRDAVIEVMIELGGYAKLGDLYRHALNVPGVNWGTKTPFASMRRIVQTNPQFYKISPGLWALEAYRDKLPFNEQAREDAPAPVREAFNHSYFQGLLVEIGNFRNFTTYVPPQDKNRAFLDKPLDAVTTVKKIYSFSYLELTNRARTVDVIWFNHRKMPNAFIEVEHSTDISNSLGKFMDLQDFYAEFTIAAPNAREAEFLEKRGRAAYKPIEKRVKFWGYDSVAEAHSHFAGLAALGLLGNGADKAV
jgi:hypothetical protein